MKRRVFQIIALGTFIVFNVAIVSNESKSMDLELNSLMKFRFANAEIIAGTYCQTGDNYCRNTYPCGNGYKSGTVSGSLYCAILGDKGHCGSGTYAWTLKCDGTKVGSDNTSYSPCGK